MSGLSKLTLTGDNVQLLAETSTIPLPIAFICRLMGYQNLSGDPGLT